jgi:hypothetical protein
MTGLQRSLRLVGPMFKCSRRPALGRNPVAVLMFAFKHGVAAVVAVGAEAQDTVVVAAVDVTIMEFTL